MNSLGYRVCWSDEVYLPSDDTLLLMKALDIVLDEPGVTRRRALEVGSGTGILSLHLLRRGFKEVYAVDLNPHAARATRCTLEENVGLGDHVGWEVIACDLASCVRDGAVFDIVVFNPPYLPSDGRRVTWVDRAWDGGPSGVEVLLRLLGEVSRRRLAPRALFVVSSLSGEALGKLYESLPEHRVVGEMAFFFERLYAVEAVFFGEGQTGAGRGGGQR